MVPSPILFCSLTDPLPFAIPAYPPRSSFDAPTWLEPNETWVVTDVGRVGGRLFEAGISSRFVTEDGAPWTPSASHTRFAAFHVGRVVCDDGEGVEVGAIVLAHPPRR